MENYKSKLEEQLTELNEMISRSVMCRFSMKLD